MYFKTCRPNKLGVSTEKKSRSKHILNNTISNETILGGTYARSSSLFFGKPVQQIFIFLDQGFTVLPHYIKLHLNMDFKFYFSQTSHILFGK